MALVQLSRRISSVCYLSRPGPRRFCATTPDVDAKAKSGKEKEESPQPEDEKDELTLLFDTVLTKVPDHGWTDRAISEAVSDLGWSPAAKRMITRGPVQVVEEFVRRCNVDLALKLAEDASDLDVKGELGDMQKRAQHAIQTRIGMIEPYHNSWPGALALQSLPQNSTNALKASAMMIDEIAHYAGYRAPNISWYTDRAVLGLAYHTTELYWLTDKSEGRVDTWRFLERNLRNSHDLRSGVGSAYEKFMTLSDAATGTLSTIIQSTRKSY